MALQRFPKFFYTVAEATKFAEGLVGKGGIYEVKTYGPLEMESVGPAGTGVWQRVPNVAVFFDSRR